MRPPSSLSEYRYETAAESIAGPALVYFADTRSPWQRGTSENTNGLLRQYFPNGTSMAGLTQTDLDTVALKLNTRPRKALGYRTPATVLEHVLR